jgi:hypothetical protein
MNLRANYLAAAVTLASAVGLEAQQPGVRIDEDHVTIRGCVMRAEGYAPADRMPIVWSRNDILVSLVGGVYDNPAASNPAGHVFYYLEDEDFTDRVGRLVEIRGDLEDVKKGEVEIERKDDFTEIELKFSGRTERARIPTPWFATRKGDEREYQVIVQRVDVEDVRELGACNR